MRVYFFSERSSCAFHARMETPNVPIFAVPKLLSKNFYLDTSGQAD